MSLRDFLFALPILLLALYVLYRTTFRSSGRCVGCSGGGCETRPAKERLVTLGRGEGRGQAGEGPLAPLSRAR